MKNIFTQIKNSFSRRQEKQKITINNGYIPYNNSETIFFDGEKSLGMLGVPKNYIYNYQKLRVRSWEAYHVSEVAKIAINTHVNWVVGSGLKLQAEPMFDILENNNIIINDKEKFTKNIENVFKIITNSKFSDRREIKNMHENALEAYKTALISGDCLVILSLNKDNYIQTNIIDGMHINDPSFGSINNAIKRGNTIINGIEIDKRGRHVAFYVNQDENFPNYKRIKAKDSKGRRIAYLLYGDKNKIEEQRGIPLLSSVLQTLNNLDRYKEAVVGSAEERQKIPFTIEHNEISTGENPYSSQLRSGRKVVEENGNSNATISETETALNRKFYSTTGKQVVNMPRGASLKSIESKNELHFSEFYDVNFKHVIAALGIPPEIAKMDFQNNFSASRAALKLWEKLLLDKREKIKLNYYMPYYSLFVEIGNNMNMFSFNDKEKIEITKIFNSNNTFLREALLNARFTGTKAPHVDPVKEVQAEILALENNLTTHEAASEKLNYGDWASNIEQKKSEERKIGKENENI